MNEHSILTSDRFVLVEGLGDAAHVNGRGRRGLDGAALHHVLVFAQAE